MKKSNTLSIKEKLPSEERPTRAEFFANYKARREVEEKEYCYNSAYLSGNYDAMDAIESGEEFDSFF